MIRPKAYRVYHIFSQSDQPNNFGKPASRTVLSTLEGQVAYYRLLTGATCGLLTGLLLEMMAGVMCAVESQLEEGKKDSMSSVSILWNACVLLHHV